MKIETTRFGTVEIPDDKLLMFPLGLPGFTEHLRWCLLHSEGTEAVNWLQSADHPEIALIIADPEVLFHDYDVEVEARDLAPIGVVTHEDSSAPPIVLRVVLSMAPAERILTANLFAPILINLDTRLALQLPLRGTAYGLRHPLPEGPDRVKGAVNSQVTPPAAGPEREATCG